MTAALPLPPTSSAPSALHGRPHSIGARTRQLADQFTAYLPLALMAVLAGMTFWLLRITPVPAEAQAERAPSQAPDNYLVNFVARSFDAHGELTAQVAGEAAQHLPATGELRIQVARLSAWGDNVRTEGSAQAAVVNQAQTQFELTGNVELTREPTNAPKLRITGEHVFIDTELERIRADLPVHVRRGNNDIRAQRMLLDNATGIAQFNDRVRVVVQPR